MYSKILYNNNNTHYYKKYKYFKIIHIIFFWKSQCTINWQNNIYERFPPEKQRIVFTMLWQIISINVPTQCVFEDKNWGGEEGCKYCPQIIQYFFHSSVYSQIKLAAHLPFFLFNQVMSVYPW